MTAKKPAPAKPNKAAGKASADDKHAKKTAATPMAKPASKGSASAKTSQAKASPERPAAGKTLTARVG
ncbi:MAG: hypothetical protein OEW90_16375, partial [Betaproteobacteria bacterium]|nr:hypothetical protein [Betaproteobacteria bacterium]